MKLVLITLTEKSLSVLKRVLHTRPAPKYTTPLSYYLFSARLNLRDFTLVLASGFTLLLFCIKEAQKNSTR